MCKISGPIKEKVLSPFHPVVPMKAIGFPKEEAVQVSSSYLNRREMLGIQVKTKNILNTPDDVRK